MKDNNIRKIALFVRSIIWNLGIPQRASTVLYEDNDTAIAMVNAQKFTPHAQHMDIKYKVLVQWVDRNLIHLDHVDTKQNMVDHFTKPLGPQLFCRHTDYIMGRVPPQYSSRFRNMRELVLKKPHPSTPVAEMAPLVALTVQTQTCLQSLPL